jgi:GTP cyclohydrolase I
MHSADIQPAAEAFIAEVLKYSGTALNGHTAGTPKRVAKAYAELLTPEPFEFTAFDNTAKYDQVILCDGVRFYSLCPHHCLLWFGSASVGYIPGKKYVGLSKLPRTVKYFSRGLVTQEEMTQKIGEFLLEKLEPIGVAVIVRARHTCLEARGAQAPGTVTTTSYLHGALRENATARSELFSLMHEVPL